jgi:hypothetical protein
MSLSSSTLLTFLRSTAASTEAAGCHPICGSTGPRTADGASVISLAARAMSVPPLIA